MTTTLACPDETELLALAMGEPVAAALASHVNGCAASQTKFRRLQAEVALLRQNHERGTAFRSAERALAELHDAEPPNAGATTEWSSFGTAGPDAVAAARAMAEGDGEFPDAIGKYLQRDAGVPPKGNARRDRAGHERERHSAPGQR
jgi:hypothetical protein